MTTPAETGTPAARANRLPFRLCTLAAVLLSVLTFTPLVIPHGRYEPMLGGVPYSLWVGIAIAFAFVLLTLVGVYVYPDAETEEAGR